MAIYDLTHLMHAGMPVYPGKQQPEFLPSATLSGDGYRELHLGLDGHTGTHMDAPAHMLENGKTLDKYPASRFTGTACIISVGQGKTVIDKDDLLHYESMIRESDFVLFRTQWSQYWGSDAYLRNFPVLTEQAVEWLTTFSLKGIGVDVISVDPTESTTWAVHHILFRNDLVIIENLCFPDELTETRGTFHCFPLRIDQSDGSPVRAIFSV